MKLLKIFAVVAGLSTLLGCQGFYTSIRQIDDTHYMVTKTTAGFFRAYGTVMMCEAAGTTGDLQCSEIDSP